ncbi:MAG: hypothetical protein IJ636_04525 [Bacteroidales bacterium]|nr:hypothetical protein [Bacteroidales bacterium]
MHFKTFKLLAALAALLVLGSCQDTSIKRNLYDDWWPIHAKGSYDDGNFTAKWDGDLGARGGLLITFTNKKDPSLQYTDVWYFNALSFANDRKTFKYITIKNLDYESSRSLNYEVKGGKIYFEKMNEAGRGTGEFDEGKDIKFLTDVTVQIDEVTYERYSSYRARKLLDKDESLPPLAPDGRIPIKIYR